MTAIRLLFATLATLLAATLAPAFAAAAPQVDGEFALTGKPVHLTLGPDGNMWVALSDSTGGNDVAKVTPAGGVTEFDLPGILNTAGIVTGPDGKLWATHSTGGGGVFRFLPADPLGGADVPVSDITDARSIVVGSDGNLWTASGDKAIRITPVAVPVATPFTVTGMAAHDIVRGGDGLLYIAEGGSGAGHVVGLTTDGRPTLYATGGGQGVAAGPANQIAYTNPVNSPEQIGRITPGTLRPLITDVLNVDPTGIVFGNDGAYWIANFGDATLGRFTTDGQLTFLSGLSALSGPRWIATGPNDTLWVGLETAQRVARVTGVSAPPPTTPPGGGTTNPPGGGTTTPPADVRPPVLTNLLLPKRLHPGQHSTIQLTLSEAATLSLRFTRVLPGRRVRSGRCVRPTRGLRRRPRCTRVVNIGTLTRRAAAGDAKLSWDGKVAGHKLSVGSYRLTVGGKDAAGNAAIPIETGFKVVRPVRHRRPRARTHR
jgi:streptogramin lyase